MKTEANTVSAVIAAALGAVASYFVRLLIPLIILVLVMLVDYGTGMAKAWVKNELSSRIGLRGLLKKLGYFVTVIVAGVMDWLIGYGLESVGVEFHLPFLLAAIVMVWLIINELISILENVAAIGGPVPPFITKLLARLKKSVEDKTGDIDNEPVDAGVDYKTGYFDLMDELCEVRAENARLRKEDTDDEQSVITVLAAAGEEGGESDD